MGEWMRSFFLSKSESQKQTDIVKWWLLFKTRQAYLNFQVSWNWSEDLKKSKSEDSSKKRCESRRVSKGRVQKPNKKIQTLEAKRENHRLADPGSESIDKLIIVTNPATGSGNWQRSSWRNGEQVSRWVEQNQLAQWVCKHSAVVQVSQEKRWSLEHQADRWGKIPYL